MTKVELSEVLLEVLDSHMDTDGRFGEDCLCRWIRGDQAYDDHLAAVLAPAVLAWVAERDAVQSAVRHQGCAQRARSVRGGRGGTQ